MRDIRITVGPVSLHNHWSGDLSDAAGALLGFTDLPGERGESLAADEGPIDPSGLVGHPLRHLLIVMAEHASTVDRLFEGIIAEAVLPAIDELIEASEGSRREVWTLARHVVNPEMLRPWRHNAAERLFDLLDEAMQAHCTPETLGEWLFPPR